MINSLLRIGKLVLNNTNDQESTPRLDSTLSKGLSILEFLAQSPNGIGVTELSRELNLTKSNTFRLLRTLSALGYVKPLQNKKYCVTMKTWQIGQQIVSHLNLQEIAAPQMLQLSQETGETIYLAIRDGLMVIYLDKIESSKPIRSWTPKGGSAPIHCVGTGKALLAAEYDLLREQIRNNLTRYTPQTITSIKKLDEDVASTQERGYSIDCGEYRDQIWSFGASIHLPNTEVVAALGVSVPYINLAGNRETEIGVAVKKAAELVSATLVQM